MCIQWNIITNYIQAPNDLYEITRFFCNIWSKLWQNCKILSIWFEEVQLSSLFALNNRPLKTFSFIFSEKSAENSQKLLQSQTDFNIRSSSNHYNYQLDHFNRLCKQFFLYFSSHFQVFLIFLTLKCIHENSSCCVRIIGALVYQRTKNEKTKKQARGRKKSSKQEKLLSRMVDGRKIRNQIYLQKRQTQMNKLVIKQKPFAFWACSGIQDEWEIPWKFYFFYGHLCKGKNGISGR